MSQFQKLEIALRRHGFVIGALDHAGEELIDKLLKDVREIFDPSQDTSPSSKDETI